MYFFFNFLFLTFSKRGRESLTKQKSCVDLQNQAIDVVVHNLMLILDLLSLSLSRD
jgi:hypothetical protein